MTYKNRVRALENMGATTSDAQAAVDAELEKEGKNKMRESGEIDPYIIKHLDAYIQNHIRHEDSDAFRNFALSRINEEDPAYALSVNWTFMYGQFCASDEAPKRGGN